MTPRAFQRALVAFTRRKPFLPFQIELISGDQFLIAHPEALRIRGNLILHVVTTGRQRLFEPASVCQLLDKETQPHLPSFDDDSEE
jgi:hypothetical protein